MLGRKYSESAKQIVIFCFYNINIHGVLWPQYNAAVWDHDILQVQASSLNDY